MIYKEDFQDLFKVSNKEYVFAHCVARDLSMGAGIAKEFIRHHPDMRRYCQEAASNNYRGNVIGNAIRYKDNTRIIYNMISKDFSWKAAKNPNKRWLSYREVIPYETYMQNLHNCLEDIKSQMKENEEKKLCMPQIAAGLDKCEWVDVKNLIRKVFQDTDIEIFVCIDPKKKNEYILEQ